MHKWTAAENTAALYLARCYGNKGYKNDPIALTLINHGITKASLHMALGNFLSLYKQGGLGNTSKAQRTAFLRNGSLSSDQLRAITYAEIHHTTPTATEGKYVRPAFLIPIIPQTAYSRWLLHKARAHVKRDRKRGNSKITIEAYKIAIHSAVLESGGRDAYTGERLKWELISQYNNEDSKAERRAYKANFALLPTIDHVGDGKGVPCFKICSWRTNSAKSDLSLPEFVELCKKVVARHRE